jgi:hypothetical protein
MAYIKIMLKLCNSILMIFVSKKAPSTIVIATGKNNIRSMMQ